MKKKLALIILSVISAICCAVELTACTATNTPSNNVDPADPDATITNPSDGDATDPTDSNTTEPNTTEQHSQIFYDVLNSSYYNNLYEENKTSAGSIWAENACAPIPFSFLEQMGYDTDAIKNGDIECESTSYIKDDETNKLYVTVRVENSANFKHYTCYVLTYPINNLEYSDLTYLANNSLIQSSFYIQELSYQKTPTIESAASITVSAYNGIIKLFEDTYTENVTMDFTHFSIEDNTLECTMRPSYMSNVLTKNTLIRYAKLKPWPEGDTISALLNNSIYNYPDHYVTYQNNEAKELYKENPTSVTYLSIQSKRLYNWLKISDLDI